MIFETGKYYHFYNRSNNEEKLFKEEKNYRFFLGRYQQLMGDLVSTLAYCLMPTHFHFIIKINTTDYEVLKKNIAVLLSSYTKAINNTYSRHGSLFQPRSKAKVIDDINYLITVISYVHQNPVRAKLVSRLKDWKYSSYHNLTGNIIDAITDTDFIRQRFDSYEKYREFSEELVNEIKRECWV